MYDDDDPLPAILKKIVFLARKAKPHNYPLLFLFMAREDVVHKKGIELVWIGRGKKILSQFFYFWIKLAFEVY